MYNTAEFAESHEITFRTAALGEIVTLNDMEGSTFKAAKVRGAQVYGRNADGTLFGPYLPYNAGHNPEGYAVNVPV